MIFNMNTILFLINIIFLVIIFIQYITHKRYVKDIKYIHSKLKGIAGEDTAEKILLFTHNEELKSLLIEINNLLEQKQKNLANFIKSEASIRKMLSNISHDLKTPLTVVVGYIEMIERDKSMDARERAELLIKVQSKAQEVLDLINKFFDLAKLEAGDKDIPVTRVNLNEVCRKNILDFYDVLTVKGIEVFIDIPDEEIYCQGNEEALSRILNNLISNAIKYGSEGKVLGISLYSDTPHAFISIWDKGQGIGEAHKEKVFERMYTLEDSRNKSYEGSGLGLSITKRLVERLGGEIYLESKPHEKTTFIVKLKRVNY